MIATPAHANNRAMAITVARGHDVGIRRMRLDHSWDRSEGESVRREREPRMDTDEHGFGLTAEAQRARRRSGTATPRALGRRGASSFQANGGPYYLGLWTETP